MKLAVRRLNETNSLDVTMLQACFNDTPSYWSRITGARAKSDGAKDAFQALPPGKTYTDKFVLGFFLDEEIVGGADLIRGFPRSETAMLGLLIIREDYQGRGIGKQAYEEIEKFIRTSWPEITVVRIGVIATNEPAFPFWRGRGFKENGQRKPYRENEIISENVILEKPL